MKIRIWHASRPCSASCKRLRGPCGVFCGQEVESLAELHGLLYRKDFPVTIYAVNPDLGYEFVIDEDY